MWKKWVALSAVFALVVFLAGSVLSEYGKWDPSAVAINETYKNRYTSEDDANWEELSKQGMVILENTGYRLELDAESTRFSMTDKSTGVVYDSYAAEELNWVSEEVRRRSASNLAVMYYDENHAEAYLASGEDAVQKGQYTIKRRDNTLRITYVLGSSAEDLFAPYIIPQEVFEQRILPQLSSDSDRRSMKRYYTLYSKEKAPGDYKEMVEEYPFLKERTCYVLTRTTESTLGEITEYVLQTDYTQEEYQAFRQQYGFDNPSYSLQPGYTIPMEITLNEDGFSVRVLSDRIETHNQDYPLCVLYLLEFFGCTEPETSGSYLVPDGSGAEILFNENGQTPYTQKLYGEDYAQPVDEQQQLSRNAVMPVLGRMGDEGGYLLIVEGGAEAASVNVQTAGTLSPVNKAYFTFQMTAAVHTSLGDRRGMSNYILYSKDILHEFPEVRCIFAEGTSSLPILADLYRGYLSNEGILEYSQLEEELPLYLDFLCLTTTQENFLGIPYTKKHVLSTIEDIQAIVCQLHEAGIRNLRIRLRGWTAGGLRHGAFDNCRIDSAVGTSQQLQELSDLLQSAGGILYLDADFSFSFCNSPFDSFRKARDTVKQLEKSVAIFPFFDLVTLQATTQYGENYLVSPMAYSSYADRFLESFQQQNYSGNTGLSWSGAGQYLYSDFQTNMALDRSQSANLLEEVLGKMADDSVRLMTDYGNAYTWSYVDDIVGIPTGDSLFLPEAHSVPFLQMVLSGGITYAGQPLNLGFSDRTMASVYSGLSAPYFLLITEDNQVLKEAELQHRYYSLQFDNADVQGTYLTMQRILEGCYGKRIVDFSTKADNVTETLLEDETKVIVSQKESGITVDIVRPSGTESYVVDYRGEAE